MLLLLLLRLPLYSRSTRGILNDQCSLVRLRVVRDHQQSNPALNTVDQTLFRLPRLPLLGIDNLRCISRQLRKLSLILRYRHFSLNQLNELISLPIPNHIQNILYFEFHPKNISSDGH